MSKVIQIQRALSELSGGEFQKLADAYLMELGYGRINSIGSVVAANKVRIGTPDTLIVSRDGSYVFAEYTTQQRGLLAKIKDDLAKCFDERKTGVPVDRISRVVYCFTGTLNAGEVHEVTELCSQQNVELDLFGIDAIAFDCYRKYPGLACDFLGVTIDTGQIVSPDQFVAYYNSGKLSTRLDLDFHFREQELPQVLGAMENNMLTVLSGRSGVGKSRLALEACERFSKAHPEYQLYCVFGRGIDLWEDLRVRFTRSGHFLILVDDANRVSRFEYLVDILLHEQRDDRCFKVLATVRDYALSAVREAARPLGMTSEVELGAFTDDEIKTLVTDEYGIVNFHYLERIAAVVQGNPRLAVMAAEVAREAPLDSLHDVSSLYDSYFSSIRADLKGMGVDPVSADLLRVAAIVSFFKAVDRTNEDMMLAIEKAFGITLAGFWEAAERLHEMEILDMHEDEVVQVSDQVLGTYLFYLAFFRDRVLDFGALISHFFSRIRNRIVDSINPVLSAFDSELVCDAMRPHVERLWAELESMGSDEDLFQLIDLFWFVRPTATLLWISAHIEGLTVESVDIDSISFAKDSRALPAPSILSILQSLAYEREENVKIALQLLLRYLEKHPAEVPSVLKVLVDGYGFRPESYRRCFEIQRTVIDELWRVAEGRDPIFSRVFLAVAGHFLGTHFENTGMKDNRTVLFTNFNLPATPELAILRETIWTRLFSLYEEDELQSSVLETIRRYCVLSFRPLNIEVVHSDASHVLPFLESILNPTSYSDCTLMHNYLDFLEVHGGDAHDALRSRFHNETFALAEVLLLKWSDRMKQGESLEAFEAYKRNRLDSYTEDYSSDDYDGFIERCCEIRDALEGGYSDFSLRQEVVNVLLVLADRDTALYCKVLERYLQLGDPLRLEGRALVMRLLGVQGDKNALRLLQDPEYPSKRLWLFSVYEGMKRDDLDEKVLAQLYELYGAAELAELPHGYDNLLEYCFLDKRVIAKVVRMVVDKVTLDPRFAYVLEMLFNPFTAVVKRLAELFADDLDVLKQAYFLVDGMRDHHDQKGELFNLILTLDAEFIFEYFAWRQAHAERLRMSNSGDHRDYSFIWLRPDHQRIMDRVLAEAIHSEQNGVALLDLALKQFFLCGIKDGESNGEALERQNDFLTSVIDERSGEGKVMKGLFGVIAHFKPERRIEFVRRFLLRNKDVEVFRRLSLEPHTWSWSGSMVPVLHRRLSFFESLKPLMNSIELLPHRQLVEQDISALRVMIEREKKSDFIDA